MARSLRINIAGGKERGQTPGRRSGRLTLTLNIFLRNRVSPILR